MKDMVITLGHHPIIGGAISGIHIALGYLIGFMIDIPPVVMQLVQLCVWMGGIAVSFVTVVGWLKNNTNLIDHWQIFKK
jgi:hypothetical protein